MAFLLVIIYGSLQLFLKTPFPSLLDIALKFFLCKHQDRLHAASIEKQAMCFISERFLFQRIYLVFGDLMDICGDVLLDCSDIGASIHIHQLIRLGARMQIQHSAIITPDCAIPQHQPF